MIRNPIQPLILDKNGVLRFKQNKIVDALLSFAQEKGFGLNEIACGNFSDDDRMQLAQLIGYSLSGYGDLSYVSNDSYDAAEKMAEGVSEDRARADALQETLDAFRLGAREAIATIYGTHPDNLMEID
jgi:hypothetical protein